MTDDIEAQIVEEGRNQGRRRGEWYYAALCVTCRVCGARVGELCHTVDGEIFDESWKHHFWRYRDVRHYLGRDHPDVKFVDRQTWRRERQQRNELVNA